MKKTIYCLSLIIMLTSVGCQLSKEDGASYIVQKQVTIPEEFVGRLSIFILVGQSNMSGRGEMPAQPQPINPRVFVFGNDYRWHYAMEPIDNPTGQVDLVSIDNHAGYSIATAFANTMLEKDPELVIGFIPCAAGGSSIQKWQRNLSDHTLYGSCLKRARAASPMGEIAGLLFCQGAADGRDPEKYPAKLPSPFEWGEKYTQFITDIRQDLGMADLPVVFSQIGKTANPDGWPYWDLIKNQQADVSLPHMIMTSNTGLPLNADVHITKEGLDILGKRFAEAFRSLSREKNK